jgi:hypothetical protein
MLRVLAVTCLPSPTFLSGGAPSSTRQCSNGKERLRI